MKELITIIITTYNRPEFLERAIKSALNQTYKNIEILVVDDNAKLKEAREETAKIVASFENVKLIKNKENLGGGLSRNEGIKHANGKFIAFLDDDDEFIEDKIQKQYNCWKNSENPGVVYAYADIYKENGTKYMRKKDVEGNVILENIKACLGGCSYLFFSKEILEEVGMFEDVSSRQDATLMTKILLKGYNAYRVPEVLLKYYWHTGENGNMKLSSKTLVAEKQYYQLFLDNAKNLDKSYKKKCEYEFFHRLIKICIFTNEKKEAYGYWKKMWKIKKISKKTILNLIIILFSKMYVKLSNAKEKKIRVGK